MLKYLTAILLGFLIIIPPIMAEISQGELIINPESKMITLNSAEKKIILEGGTEAPFSGKLLLNKEQGLYVCRQCGQALYDSSAKFDSNSGWPSFDDFIPGSVTISPDPDGRRQELLCASCKGHLGHVFEGEGFTEKNIRHCVNSLSLDFVPKQELLTAVFAGGCFWGVEDIFSRLPGVVNVVSGYTGGTTVDPTYKQVSAGATGHAEAVEVTYDAASVDYETLARLFFEIHDPTQLNAQGPDKGTQYRSAVFYGNEKQKQVAQKLIQMLNSTGIEVVTQVEPLAKFYEAEEYHQDYIRRTGREACQTRVKRFRDNH